MEQVMEPFWRSLCECKLLPITTDYFPEEKEIKITARYHNELSQVNHSKTGFIRTIEDYLTEYICLRLTQNFQLINPSPTCNIDFQGLLMRGKDLKMSMGKKYNVLSAYDRENFQIEIFTKLKGGSEDPHSVNQADFKYMLYNFHTNKF